MAKKLSAKIVCKNCLQKLSTKVCKKKYKKNCPKKFKKF